MGHGGLRDQVEESIEKSQSRAQDRHENDAAGHFHARGDFQRRVARNDRGFQIRGDRRHHQRGDPADPLAELRATDRPDRGAWSARRRSAGVR